MQYFILITRMRKGPFTSEKIAFRTGFIRTFQSHNWCKWANMILFKSSFLEAQLCQTHIGETRRAPPCTIKAEKTRLILHAGRPLRGRLKELCVNGPNYTLTPDVMPLESGEEKAEGRCEACLLIYEGIRCKEERPIILTSQPGKCREYLGQALGESF